MKQHTEEPWHVDTPLGHLSIFSAEGNCIIPTYPGIKAANARRIVACINACAGIPTEALEAFAKKGILGQLWRDEWEHAFNKHEEKT